MYHKYGKTYDNMWKFKNGLSTDNDALISHNRGLYDFYNVQPERTKCNICAGGVNRFEFHSHGVKYFCCDQCGHINGSHEDTMEYCQRLYESDDGCFGNQYEDIDLNAFNERKQTIYVPKVKFMLEAFDSYKGKYDVTKMKFLDIGAGSGHLVLAMHEFGLNATGIDVDIHQVRHANKILPKGLLQHCPSKSMIDYISNTEADVITCIYAFEHITNVTEIFDAINKNSNIKFIYFSVPMLGVTSMMECVNPKVFARVLHAAYTHIYTDESLEWICEKYGWNPLADWWFGSDAADALRTIMVQLEKQGDIGFADYYKEKFTPMIDELQGVMNKYNCCSDIHMLVEKIQ